MTEQSFDVSAVRNDFPLLSQKVYDRPLVYLDNAATTQKPAIVLEALEKYYETYNSNVHRGVHFLSQKATDAQEAARHTVADFINAAHDCEVLFTKGTTDGINIVARSFGKQYLKPGDEVVITEMEHHSNIVPWQLACEERGAVLKYIPMLDDGSLDISVFDEQITERTKIVACTWVSNSLGTINPMKEIIRKAHDKEVPVLVDAAQAIQHLPVDVQELDADFLVFSGHKIYGPTGIGVLYGKEQWLEEMPPCEGGGSMIKTVTMERTTYAELPFKFEAGTPHVAGAIGLAAALKYLNGLNMDQVIQAEHQLMAYARESLSTIKGIQFIGATEEKAGAHSFLIREIHPFDLGELLDKQSIAVRTGHHCCQPVMDHFGIPGTVRASFAFYNTREEVDLLVAGIKKSMAMLV